MNSAIISICFTIIFLLNAIGSAQANVLVKPADDKNDDESISVAINPPANLNFQSKAEILARREKYLQQNHALLQDKYKPSPSVFHLIEDKKPWWGMHGAFIWGPGPHSIDGPAEESRFILNPLLLVGANPNTALIWQDSKICQADLDDPSFPLCWLPTALTYFPGLALAQVTYPVSEFNHQVKLRHDKLRFNPMLLKINSFAVTAYNARDFGYQYIYVDIGKSINIINTIGCNSPVFIKQMIHCGNSSKYPGGCNNMSPAMPEIDRFAITNLPARACAYLWKNKPSSIQQTPDFTFYLDFR